MRILYCFLLMSTVVSPMDKPLQPHESENQPLYHVSLVDDKPTEIPKTVEDKQFVITKAKIAAVVTVSLSIITAAVTLGVHFADCKKE